MRLIFFRNKLLFNWSKYQERWFGHQGEGKERGKIFPLESSARSERGRERNQTNFQDSHTYIKDQDL